MRKLLVKFIIVCLGASYLMQPSTQQKLHMKAEELISSQFSQLQLQMDSLWK